MSGYERNIDVRAFNRQAWDKNVENGNPWTVPASEDVIAAARRGDWKRVTSNRGQKVSLAKAYRGPKWVKNKHLLVHFVS